jgi:biopolymer transport protein ExbD
MARVFKRKDRLSAMSEINLTSLMDLVFCLLIIFMITTPLLEQTIPLNLPQQSRNPDSSRDQKLKFQPISIDAQGQYFWGTQPVDADELRARLEDLGKQPDPPVISLRGDRALPYQKVIDVLDMIKQAGLVKLNLDTQVK